MWVPEGRHQGEHQCCAVGAAWAGGCLTPWEGAGESVPGWAQQEPRLEASLQSTRGMGRGTQWDIIAPLESPSAVTHCATVWHSTRFTFTSYWKIEPFFIEK